MSHDVPTLAPLLGGVGLLERAVDYLVGNLDAVTPAMLTNPTPCRDWDLRALLEHVSGSLEALTEAALCGRVGGVFVDARDARLVPVAVVREQATAVLDAWLRAERTTVCVNGLPLTSPVLVGAGALELAVHGWDIARACGRRDPIPSPLADDLLALSKVLVSPADRPVRFAAPVPISPVANPSDRLVAFLGRRPH
jgi:uncharacterized protein (TIGR03086 family)